jgi:hypothetical protein
MRMRRGIANVEWRIANGIDAADVIQAATACPLREASLRERGEKSKRRKVERR